MSFSFNDGVVWLELKRGTVSKRRRFSTLPRSFSTSDTIYKLFNLQYSDTTKDSDSISSSPSVKARVRVRVELSATARGVEMQQQPPQMMNISPSFPPTAITTEQIQKYLDENKQLILAILENQNLGKLTECAQYQAQLQKNLVYLAAIADAQPPAPTGPAQMPMHPGMQQGHYMQQQHPQVAAAQQQQQQQPGVFSAKLPFQLSEQQQQQFLLHLQQQQPMQGHMGMRPTVNNGMHQAMQMGLGALGGLIDLRGIKPEGSEVGSGDGQGKSASGHGSGNRDS